MKRYFGRNPDGAGVLDNDTEGDLWWCWDTAVQCGFWVNAQGVEVDTSQFDLSRFTDDYAEHYVELARLPGMIEPDLCVDEGL